ncbi:MAG: uracil phosphoribosyltransferase [Deltaproteobacteria bacterium]|jgi:uracil phosphoribosyltransferase|nr:uracil phosphoribosyltransferase [Deltaproteobacteria bacterium]MBT6432769.1 uracil phosphoribosyltransferase [Deltaproteobacteria bacterium]
MDNRKEIDPSAAIDACRILNHPILQHNLTKLRNRETKPVDFRRVMDQLSALLAYEITRDISVSQEPVTTPLEETKGAVVSDDLVIVSIMRAGNGMLDGLLRMLPFSRVGHIGIYRDKFIGNTVEYYFRLPDEVKGRKILLADPLIATGDTAVASIDRLKEYGVESIRFVSLLASPEGLAHLYDHHPDVEVYTLSVERELSSDGYILPGLGDAGDRLYGTAV